jgi:hypothetical protein
MKFYRYKGVHYTTGWAVELTTYNLHKETPHGYWIIPDYIQRNDDWANEIKRWIPKKSRKRYAYPTKEEAMTNFVARTKRYVVILEANLNAAKSYLHIADKYTTGNLDEKYLL